MRHAPSPSAPATPPARRHGTVAAGGALAVVLAGGGLLWGSALREQWALLRDARSPAGPEAPPAEAQSVQARLAFLGSDGRTLEEESREMTLKPYAPAAARAILEALREGSRAGRGAVLPSNVQVRHVFVDKQGVAYVDLSPEILRVPGAADEGKAPAAPEGAPAKAPGGGEAQQSQAVALAAQAIAAALGMSLPEIAQVQILVEGREVPVVTEALDLRRPLPASLPIRSPATAQ